MPLTGVTRATEFGGSFEGKFRKFGGQLNRVKHDKTNRILSAMLATHRPHQPSPLPSTADRILFAFRWTRPETTGKPKNVKRMVNFWYPKAKMCEVQ